SLDQDLSQPMITGLMLLAFPLSYLSWRFVERPFRDRRKITLKPMVITLIIGAIILIGAALYIDKNSYLRSDLKLRQMGYAVPETHDYETPLEDINDGNYRDRDHSWLILGDSHAQALSYALNESLNKQNADLLAPYNKGCPYVRH